MLYFQRWTLYSMKHLFKPNVHNERILYFLLILVCFSLALKRAFGLTSVHTTRAFQRLPTIYYYNER